MRIEYFSETDTLYVHLQEGPGVETLEVAPDFVLDLNEKGEVIGIEIEHAGDKTNLDSFEVSSLPVRSIERGLAP